ncbi:hypothetical protein ACP3V3_01875 [Vibrio sp. PNB22_3_1]
MFTKELLEAAISAGRVELINTDDLSIDVEQLNDMQEKFNTDTALWLVKQGGTVLLPLKKWVNPVFAESCFDVECQAYQVHLKAGIFQPVDRETALALIYEQPRAYVMASKERQCTILKEVFKERYVTDHLLSRCHLTEDSHLEQWLNYFERTYHPLMAKTIRAILA